MTIRWTDNVRNEELLQGVKEEKNILHRVKRKWANSTGHRLRGKCIIEQVIQGKIKESI